MAQVTEERIGFCFCAAPLPTNREWLPLAHGCRQGVINRGYLLYQGKRAVVVAPAVQVVPLEAFLAKFEEWILRLRTVQEAREARAQINDYRFAALT